MSVCLIVCTEHCPGEIACTCILKKKKKKKGSQDHLLPCCIVILFAGDSVEKGPFKTQGTKETRGRSGKNRHHLENPQFPA